MESENLLRLKAAIYQMGLLFNQQPTAERIDAYAAALINYSKDEIIFAFNEVIKSGSAFFPSLAEILAKLNVVNEPQKYAAIVAVEMINLMRTFGPHDEENMINAASNEARLVFKHLGHTGDIRKSENIETTKAQLERLAKAVLMKANNDEKILKLDIKQKPKNYPQKLSYDGLA